MRFGDARPLPSLMAYPYHRIQGTRAPQIQTATNGPRGAMPKPRHRKNAPARPHHARSQGHTSPSPQNDSHYSLSGEANRQVTQNDSHFQASNPEMTQNDSHFRASMTQMSQNDSLFEVFSFEMTQNDSFSGHKCPTEHPLSVADELPATPPSPQNDTPSNTRPAPMADQAPSTSSQLEQDRPQGPSIVPSSCYTRPVIVSGAIILTHA